MALAFWAIGSFGALLWTCFWIFGIIYTRKFPPVVLLMIGLGIFGTWEGFKTFRETKNSHS